MSIIENEFSQSVTMVIYVPHSSGNSDASPDIANLNLGKSPPPVLPLSHPPKDIAGSDATRCN